MAIEGPITIAEQRHCDRFCFNSGSCFECARDPFGLAQCVGCLCPQNLWAGQRCEFRVGYKENVDASTILSWFFGLLTICLSAYLVFSYFSHRKKRADPFITPLSQVPAMSSSNERLETPTPVLGHSYVNAGV
uniref:EGF-like domain-containing protein n=1 Tax=Mesocestoides corti TaxID=53468 RepID=A0A5K3EJ69_MESCO